MPDTALYAYCVISKPAKPSTMRAPGGLDGAAPVEAIAFGRGLWLVAAEVPLDRYSSAAIESGLRDLEWVSTAALAHEAVVEHFARQRTAAVVPLKLFTMFLSRDRAVAAMQRQRAELARSIRRVRGCEEWGVRLTRRPGPVSKRSSAARTPATGVGFLIAKKAVRDSAQESARAAADAANEIYRSLERHARAAVTRSDAPDPAVTPPLLDAAFLVPSARRAAFRTAVRRATGISKGAGLDLAFSGPWPAYNFVDWPELA